MNAKTCKKLRMVAREGTVGMPDRAYTTRTQGKTFIIPQLTGPSTYPDQVVLDRKCTRAAYKQLKKLVGAMA